LLIRRTPAPFLIQRAGRKTLVSLAKPSIAELVGEGMSNRDIAQHLGISKRTVDAHIEHIFG